MQAAATAAATTAAAATSTNAATGIYATERALSLGAGAKVIGVGARGISAAARLMGGGGSGGASLAAAGAEFWAIDTDAKVLAASSAPNALQLASEDDAALAPADLRRIAGGGGAAAAAAGGANAPPAATEGAVFLLAGASGVPGGAPMLLQLAASLRRAGFFVVAALTRPFDFEGRRRLEEADALIEAMADVAQLTVVVAQGVLQRASAELTIKDASAIADNTLEYSVRCVLWALGAPELLIASHAGAAWHGRDLRQYRRLLSPPLERLLTCPGSAALGRGLASIPLASLREAGLASTLSTLAEDAVTAAADSPFLDAAVGAAGGVLVVLSLPPRVLDHSLAGGLRALDDPEKYAVRAAVQVAASTVLDLAGAGCHDVVACAHVRSDDWPHGADEDSLCLEATMLVLEDPALREAAAAAAAEQGGFALMTPRRPPGAAPAGGARPLLQNGGGGSQQQQQQQAAGSAPAPRANWGAMSALAGGSASAAHTLPKPGTPQQQQQQQQGGKAASSSSTSSSSSSSSGSGGGAVSRPGSSNAGRAASPMAGRPAPPRGPSPLVGRVGSPAAPPSSPRPGSAASSDAARRSPPPPSPAGGRPGSAAGGGQQQQLIPRMADRLVDSLVAQSLDLPPTAARWRSKQRAARDAARGPARRGGGHFALGGALGGGADGGAGAPPPDLRSRVFGMLEQEREEGDAFDAYDGADDGGDLEARR